MKKFLGIINLAYIILTIYFIVSDTLKNYIAPQMRIYVYIGLFILLFIQIPLLLNKEKRKLKLFDIFLLLPIILIFFSNDGKLSLELASIKANSLMFSGSDTIITTGTNLTEEDILELDLPDTDNITSDSTYDVDIKIDDVMYEYMVMNLYTHPNRFDYVGKIISIKGFTLMNNNLFNNGYFGIGKYSITCCTADAGFLGMTVKSDLTLEKNSWYEITGVLELDKDINGNDMLALRLLDHKEISGDNEELYVYPCYTYGDTACMVLSDYNFNN